MKQHWKTLLILFVITALAFVLRFYQLGEAPAGLYLDEAAQGYNAYSILLTGADEFGKSFPAAFRSFGDFKTPIYIYLIVPFIPIFGLTPFTVRFPSFLFSILTFPLLYLFIIQLSTWKYKQTLAFLTLLLLAISPWHILFGRTNFECNVALFFLLLGIYLFHKGLLSRWWLTASLIIFAIALPAYHTERIITPIIGLALAIKHKAQLLKSPNRIPLSVGVFIAGVITLPTLLIVTTPGFLTRASTLNIFAAHTNQPFLVGIFEAIREFAASYIFYFSPRAMFYLGDYGPRSSFPDLSTYFIWQFPFYVIGIYFFLKNKNLGEIKFITLLLAVLAPIPAALTKDPYSTIRALPLVVPQLIIISFGIITLWQKVLPRFKIPVLLIAVVIFIHSLLHLYSSVIILNEYYRAKGWNYGWKQIAQTIQTLEPNLPIVVDSNDEPYIQLLFFLKYDPTKYQQENFEISLSEYYTNLHRNTKKQIGPIVTRPISWKDDLLVDQYLVADPIAISDQQIAEHHLQIIKTIYYPDQGIAFRILRTQP